MPRLIKENIDRFFDYGLYIDTRTIYLGTNLSQSDDDSVDENYAERAIKALHILDSQKQEPINIILSSPGGDEYCGMAIFDTIQACKSYVKIKIVGQASSMGSIILQSADERIMSPSSIMMIHYGSILHSDVDMSTQSNLNWANESKRFEKWMEKLYLSKIQEQNPKFTLARLQKMLQNDTILSAEMTVNMGLADKIE